MSGSAFAGQMSQVDFRNPLVNAADSGDLTSVVSGLKNGIHVDSRGEFSATALMRASQTGNAQIVELLLVQGADPDLVDLGGSSAIHVAAKKGFSNIVELLVKAEADVNSIDENGWTALMRATNAGHKDVVKMLLDAGAKVNLTNKWGQNALTISAQRPDSEMMKLFVDAGATKDLTAFDKELLAKIAKSENNSAVIAMFGANEEMPWLKKDENVLTLANQSGIEVKGMGIAEVDSESKTQNSSEIVTLEKAVPAEPKTTENKKEEVLSEIPAKEETPKEIAKAENKEKIAEAVRVPLSQANSPAKKSSFVMATHNKKPINRYEPTIAMVPYKAFWLETIPYKNIMEANSAYSQVMNLPEFKDLRVRMIQSLNGKHSQHTSIRLGPIYDQYMSARICKILTGEENRCKIIRDLKKSTSDLRKKKEQPKINSKYASDARNKIWVQFGSFSDEKKAEFKIRYLKTKFERVVEKHAFALTVPNHSSSKKDVFRLRLGPFEDSNKAGSVCLKFRNKGVNCIIVHG